MTFRDNNVMGRATQLNNQNIWSISIILFWATCLPEVGGGLDNATARGQGRVEGEEWGVIAWQVNGCVAVTTEASAHIQYALYM